MSSILSIGKKKELLLCIDPGTPGTLFCFEALFMKPSLAYTTLFALLCLKGENNVFTLANHTDEGLGHADLASFYMRKDISQSIFQTWNQQALFHHHQIIQRIQVQLLR